MATSATETRSERRFLGHPRGLATLFMTEMWERFSFYGMRSILVLFLAASAAEGGLGLKEGTAKALVGVYSAMVYLVTLPGGWVSDRVLGPRRAVLCGGAVIMLGHVALAVPGGAGFVYLGLTLIIAGTGLLKPNIATLVGHLYRLDEDARRDAGFSIFYMGINLGAFLAPLVVGTLGQRVSWHLGFGTAAAGMALGLLQYVLGGRHLNDGPPPRALSERERRHLREAVLAGCAAVAGVVLLGVATGTLTLDNVTWALAVIPLVVAVAYFGFMFFGSREITPDERARLRAYVWLFVAASVFWMVYDQAATELSTFARHRTDLSVGGWEMPSSWLQAINPIMVIVLAPLFAGLWVRTGPRLSTPLKFSVAMALCGLSFVIMALAAAEASHGAKVSVLWLVVTYLIQTAGELCLSPVGLSVTTKLAPKAFASQMIGVWYLAVAVGDAIGGQLTRLAGTALSEPAYFLMLGVVALATGAALAAGVRPLRAMMDEHRAV
ncbi:peptide MFS transporter [Actinomadura sp. DC4]|uniref:peptide MFS transporter n=1 Tax=Actinomadura sp. DC4 TaxID=3055069 RepID=UPI0025AF9351|nr:peptide MFS transporter [Actinomadura sp. DC4]MDN3355322.1 peptide MFS transporter [Actinomadura sp. DC4]